MHIFKGLLFLLCTRRLAIALSVFLLVWSGKLWTIGRYGSDLPYWDQWAKEGEYLFAPLLNKGEFWSTLLLPHNEHRIAPTLAMNATLLLWGERQWDARVQCAASAILHAALAAGLAYWSMGRLGKYWGVGAVTVVLMATMPPIAWENVLGGFQSQFYFLAGFSLLAIHALLNSRSFSIGWFCGLGAAGLACVSMGSGMLVSIPIGLVAILRIAGPNRGSDVRSASATLIVALIIGGVGWQFRPAAPWHESLHGNSIAETASYAMRCLAWPVYNWPAIALLLWAPWTVLAIRRISTRGRRPFVIGAASPLYTYSGEPAKSASLGDGPALEVNSEIKRGNVDKCMAEAPGMDYLFATGAWVILQAIAVSYSRAGASAIPAGRYGDIFALGLVVNFLSLAVLLGELRSERSSLAECALPPARRGLWFAFFAAWIATVIIGVVLTTVTQFQSHLPKRKDEFAAYERNVQAFVLSDNYETFKEQAGALPFPDPDWLARIIRNPTLRALLPASVRDPLLVSDLANDSPRPDSLPELLHRRTRTVMLGSNWKSGIIPSSDGWWKIETAGDVGQVGATLALMSERGVRVLAPISPSKPAGLSWRAAYVPAPRERSVFVAEVSEPASWIAFSEPIQMSSLSYRVWRLTQQAQWLYLGAAVLLIVSGVSPAAGAFLDRSHLRPTE